jgi:ParB/RepB/Spo0J family partition protein
MPARIREKSSGASKPARVINVAALTSGGSRTSSSEGLLKLPSDMFYIDVQVRTQIDTQEIAERQASLIANGQLQAIKVGPANEQGKYPILMGQCRWLASKRIPGFLIEALVDRKLAALTRVKILAAQVAENEQRSPLTKLELAAAFYEMSSGEDAMDLAEIAESVGWISKAGRPDKGRVSLIRSLNKMPDAGKQLIIDGVISDPVTLDCLRKISEINDVKFQALCSMAREEGLPRRRAENEYKRCKHNDQVDSARSQIDPDNKLPEEVPTDLAPSIEESREAGLNDNHYVPGSITAHEAETVPVTIVTTKKKAKKNAPISQSNPPVVHVVVDGQGTGTLCFSTSPGEDGWAWVTLEIGDRQYVELTSVHMVRVTC